MKGTLCYIRMVLSGWIWLWQAAVVAEGLAPDLSPPIPIMAEGKPIDIQRNGGAVPRVVDFDRDGVDDLIVAESGEGRIRYYRNLGDNLSRRFSEFEWLHAKGTIDESRDGWHFGISPQFVDFDRDGRDDVVSLAQLRSKTAVYWFRQEADGSFAAGVQLLPLGTFTDWSQMVFWSAMAADWDSDGDLDLIIGTHSGSIHVARNISKGVDPVFGPLEPIVVDQQTEDRWWFRPILADWDADGLSDLVWSSYAGDVWWNRNEGDAVQPRLVKGVQLVPVSVVDENTLDKDRQPGAWGNLPSICVTDWNHDGKQDLLLGDRCGSFVGKPTQTPQEAEEENKAVASLPVLIQKWSRAFQELQMVRARVSTGLASADDNSSAQELLKTITELRQQITDSEDVIDRYKSREQSHGFVWLFLRK
jgi:FG-GAP-like repeat